MGSGRTSLHSPEVVKRRVYEWVIIERMHQCKGIWREQPVLKRSLMHTAVPQASIRPHETDSGRQKLEGIFAPTVQS